MTAITVTEAGATGRYIDIAANAALDNIFNGVNGGTIAVYCKPAAQSVIGYLWSKCDSSANNGGRFVITTTGTLAFAPYGTSGSGQNPSRTSSSSVVNGNWRVLIGTAPGNGDMTGTNVKLYIDGTEDTSASGSNGSGSVSSDAANHMFLMNRVGLGREFVGDEGYVAIWNRVLTSTERATLNDGTHGPLDIPSGLVICFANGQDYSPTAAAVNARTTQVAGSTPPNTNLGGSSGVTANPDSATVTASAADATATGGAAASPDSATITISATDSTATGTGGGTATPDSATVSISASDATAAGGASAGPDSATVTISATDATAGAGVTIYNPADRGTLDLVSCSVTPSGTTPTINLKNRYIAEDNTSGARFTFGKVGGVNGMTPVFSVDRSNMELSSDNKWLWSYTGNLDDWHPFDNVTNGTSYYVSSNSTAFTQDTVYIAQNFPWRVGYTLPWITALATAYPSKIAFAPSGSGTYIFGTRSATADGYGNAIAAQSLYVFKITGGSGNAPDGYPKRKLMLMSGVHASEDVGNYALRGAVEFLLSADARAATVLAWFDVTVYPLVASAGRAGGAQRGDFESAHPNYDVNRHWLDTSMEAVTKHKAAVTTDCGGVIPVMLDFHGTHGIYDTYYDYFIGTTGDTTAWTNAITVYRSAIGAMHVNPDPSTSINWNYTQQSGRFNVDPEYQYHTTEVMSDVVGFGADHMRAVADLATAGVFTSGSLATPDSATVTITAADTTASGGGGSSGSATPDSATITASAADTSAAGGAVAAPDSATATMAAADATAAGGATSSPDSATVTASAADATASGTAAGAATPDSATVSMSATDTAATGGASSTPDGATVTLAATDSSAHGGSVGDGYAITDSITVTLGAMDAAATGAANAAADSSSVSMAASDATANGGGSAIYIPDARYVARAIGSAVMPAKYPSESFVLTFDFSDVLAYGETLTSGGVSFSVNSGQDTNPQGIQEGNPMFSVTGQQVMVPIGAGLSNVSYRCFASCQTSNPQKTVERLAVIPVN